MRMSFRFIAVLVFAVLCWAMNSSAEWRVDIDCDTVTAGSTGVEVRVTAYWDIKMYAFTVPLIVRTRSEGAFWSLPLPIDTSGAPAVGVTWNWFNPGWAKLKEEVRAGPLGCNPEGDTGYDAVSPDHFVINATGMLTDTPPEPTGRDVVILTININSSAGFFEFDTACYSASLDRIYMIDNELVDHGAGMSDFSAFNKGVITVQGGNGILETSDGHVPSEYNLSQNYPNPFNAATQIEFALRQDGHVKLEIFNLLGQKIATLVDEYLTAGLKRTSWDGADAGGRTVASGMYFYRLATEDFVEMKKMILMK